MDDMASRRRIPAAEAFSCILRDIETLEEGKVEQRLLDVYDFPVSFRVDRAGVLHFPATTDSPHCGLKPGGRSLKLSCRELAVDPEILLCGCLDPRAGLSVHGVLQNAPEVTAMGHARRRQFVKDYQEAHLLTIDLRR